MAVTLTNKKYLTIVPFIFFILIFSGIIGIVATSLSNPTETGIITSSGILSPGEFDTITIHITDTSSQTDLRVSIIVNSVDATDDSSTVDLFLLATKPSLEFGNDFNLLYNSSSFTDDRIDQHLSVGDSIGDSIKIFYIEGEDVVYLVIVNPQDATSEISMKAVITTTTNTGSTSTWVLSIIGTALFTLGMLLLTVFFAVEVAEPKGYKSKVLTTERDEKIGELVKDAETWETTLVVISLIALPLGAGMTFAGLENGLVGLSVVAIALVYYNINRRRELLNAIKSVMENQREMKLFDLSNQVRRKNEDVKKAIFYMISHLAYPIRFNAKTELVTYSGSQSTVVTEGEPHEMIVEKPVASKKLSCAYCGAEAIIVDAKFCADCGSSMVATK